jgi:hypothetical protein
MNAIACSLNRDDNRDRRARWHTLADRALVRVDATERGLDLVFASEPVVEAELAELAALERDCCSFATWDVEAGDERVVLHVRGDGDAIPVIQGMFASLREVIAT